MFTTTIIKVPNYILSRFCFWYCGHLNFISYQMDNFGNAVEIKPNTICDTIEYWQEGH